MPVFYPTHPEPGDPPGFYGEVYFDGEKVTDRRKPGAESGHFQMTEWFVPADADGTGADAAAAQPELAPDAVAGSQAAPSPSAEANTLATPEASPADSSISAHAGTLGTAAADAPSPTPAASLSRGPTAPVDLVRNAEEILASHDAVIAALKACPIDIIRYDQLDNETVQILHQKNAEISRLSAMRIAISTDQIVQRSNVELAGAGMARQSGDRTAVEMVKNLGGLTQREATTALQTGRMVRELQSTPPDGDEISPPTGEPDVPAVVRPAAPAGPAEPWLRPVSEALAANVLSPAQATSIRTGLGTPTDAIPSELLAEAAVQLVNDGQKLTPDKLWKLARQTRDRLDRDGVALKEAERRQMRSAKIFLRSDGMMQLNWVMDPEQGMQMKTLCDRITSPKNGGPRTGGTEAETARRIEDDPRTPDQILADSLSHLLQVGAAVDPSDILANPTSSVIVLTTRRPQAPTGQAGSSHDSGSHQADTGNGIRTTSTITVRPAGVPNPHDNDVEHHESGQYDLGWINGHPDPLSPESVERMVCAGATNEVTFTDELLPLDVSREQRLFGRKQRVALAAQFGGCTFTDRNGNRSCPRPPSWTEAHHIEHWYRDNGKTVMSNGILLCKLHHLQLHNDGWEIIRQGDKYWLIPPAKVDATQTPRLIPIASDAYRDLRDKETA